MITTGPLAVFMTVLMTFLTYRVLSMARKYKQQQQRQQNQHQQQDEMQQENQHCQVSFNSSQ